MMEELSVVIAVLNNKGGVGKTTVAVNLSAALVSSRRRVLLIDLDSQASASFWCGVRRGRLKPSSASVLLYDFPIDQAIRPTSTPRLDLITGSIELANADLALSDVEGRESTLKRALKKVRSRYEVIVLDCPPSLSLVGVNALVASDCVLIPVSPQFLVVQGLSGLLGSIETVRRRLGTRSRLLGIVITFAGARPRGVDDLREQLRAEYRDQVLHTEIDESRLLREAPRQGKDILTFAPGSKAADSFRRLAGEVLERFRAPRK